MKFPRIPRLKTNVSKLFPTKQYSNAHLYARIKQPMANQTLQKYLKSNSTTDALLLFQALLRKSRSSIDSYSLLYILKTCTRKSSTAEGKQSHALTIKLGFEPIIYLQTSLINFYSLKGNLADAHRMFDEIPIKNIVCWTALISAYVDNQKPNMALQLFRKMQMDNIEPDHVSITVALTACADLGALDMGEWIHAYLQSKELVKADLSLHNALINMYAKCGDIITARRLFDGMVNKDVTTWTSMIVGHALHGQASDALELFAKMTKNKKMGNRRDAVILPNDVTFIGVLMACGHAGLVEEGKWHFKSMSEVYGLKPRNSHFGCMVDLFCRAGLIKEAYEFILEMPNCPNAVVWRTLLGACSLHGNVELGKEVQCKLLELEPSYAGDFVAISNIYAARGMWDEKTYIRDLIAQRRTPGCSSIEVGSGTNEFVAADNDHPMKGDIYEVLQNLTRNMKAYGYAPGTSSQTEC